MNEHEREELVFDAALQLPPRQRAEYLDRTCLHNPDLRRRIERLLGAWERDAGALEEPPMAAWMKTRLAPPPANEKAGDRIGPYKLLELIGEGGCGRVYLAEQDGPVRRQVALKIIKPGMDSQSVVDRFEAERQALAIMEHPNIARFFDAGVTETARPYFVMELVRGLKITEYCENNAIDIARRLDLFVQVCRAVQHAHQKGIIHRDLKPSNVLVTLHDGLAVPKVIDFGIAKATQGGLTDRTMLTAFAQLVGTPAYMSPEQAELSGLDIDTRSDIYSLGVLLYELLTGKTPFDPKELLSAGLDEMRRTIREKDPQRPSTRWTQIQAGSSSRILSGAAPTALNPDLDWIVMKCLEKDRTRRYETANGLAVDIARHLNNEPVLARPPTAAYRLRKFVRRHKLVFATATSISAALLLGTAISIWQSVRARQAERAARLQARIATTESARAQQAERRAREESASAQRQESRAHANLYAANMRLAQFAWAQNNANQVRQLLAQTESYPRHGFEWFYWQRETRLELKTLQGHRAEVLAIAASPDGRWIATGSQDGTAILWSSDSEEPQRTLSGHTRGVSSVAFSPDSRRIVTGSWDHTAKVWETADGAPQLTLGGHSAKVFSVGFSADGRRIVTASLDHTAKVWDSSSGQEQLTLRGHRHRVWSAAFSFDGRWIVTGSQDHTARVWDAANGKELHTFSAHSGPIHSVAASPVEARVVTASRDSTARVWDLVNGGELLPPLRGHQAPILSAAFSRNGERLVTASFDQSAKVWDGATGAELFTLRGHGSPLSSAIFSANDRQIITGGGSIGIPPTSAYVDRGWGDNKVKIWTASPEQGTLSLRGHMDKVMAVAFSPDSRRVITGSFDKTAIVWDAVNGQPLFRLDHEERVRAVAISPDNQRIVTCSFDGIARVWTASGEKLLLKLPVKSDRVFSVAFSPNSELIIVGAGNGGQVWSVVAGKLVAELDGDGGWIFSAAFSPDGQRIVTSGDRSAQIWEARSGKRVRPFLDIPALSVAFSPDGDRIAMGGSDQTAKVWNALDGTNQITLTGHSAPVWSIAFSPDGRRILTASEDRSAKVWDAESGAELLTLSGHRDEIWSAAFSPDGQRIVTGGSDGIARVWTAASEEDVRRSRAETTIY
jgi:WD40 repeat protein/serine/threonine protein kinase